MSNQLTQSTRQSVFERDGYECYFCEISGEEHNKEYNEDLHIHHLVPQRANGSDNIENLIPVCTDCHTKIESTQADALERIKSEETHHKEVQELREKAKQLEAELERARANPLKELDLDPERMLINIRSGGNYKRVNFEIVADTFSTDLAVYQDSDVAREQYEEWGSVIRKEAVEIPDWMLTKFVTEILKEIRMENKKRFEDDLKP